MKYLLVLILLIPITVQGFTKWHDVITSTPVFHVGIVHLHVPKNTLFRIEVLTPTVVNNKVVILSHDYYSPIFPVTNFSTINVVFPFHDKIYFFTPLLIYIDGFWVDSIYYE